MAKNVRIPNSPPESMFWDKYNFLTVCLVTAAAVATGIVTSIYFNTSTETSSKFSPQLRGIILLTMISGIATVATNGAELLIYWCACISSPGQALLVLHTTHVVVFSALWGTATALFVINVYVLDCSKIPMCWTFRVLTGFVSATALCFLLSVLFTIYLWYKFNTGTTDSLSRGPPVLPTSNAPQHPMDNLCINCHKNPCVPYRPHCGQACVSVLKIGAPKLVPLHMTHTIARDIQTIFQNGWKHTTTQPTLHSIYVIYPIQNVDTGYFGHQNALESRHRFVNRGMLHGNEQSRWHGCTRACRLGEQGQTTPCTYTNCQLCTIIRSNFDVPWVARQGRWGTGAYTSQTTSKSHLWTGNLQIPKSPWTALLLNYVLVGNTYTPQWDMNTLVQPPAGYDSVSNPTHNQPRGPLDYDTTVVYNRDSIRPTYLVLYATPS